MRDVSRLSAADIAEDLVKLHNLPKDDSGTHEALLQEVNGYFKYNINKLKEEAKIPHSDGRPHDLRGDIIALFKNVEVQTSFDQRPGEKSPYHMDFLDEYSDKGKNFFKLNESPADRNIIPTCFQFSDSVPRPGAPSLSFTVVTNGSDNADFLYQELAKQKIPFPQLYRTWSQYWGSRNKPPVQPYQPGEQRRSKYLL